MRAAVGNDVQLCVDHFGEGYLTGDEVIRLGKALEKYNLAWMEDPVSRFDIPGHKQVADALLTPDCGRRGLVPARRLPRGDPHPRGRPSSIRTCSPRAD